MQQSNNMKDNITTTQHQLIMVLLNELMDLQKDGVKVSQHTIDEINRLNDILQGLIR